MPRNSRWVQHGPAQCTCTEPPETRLSHARRPTCTMRTRHRAAQCTTGCSCQNVPECDRISSHKTHESPGWICEMTRAQVAARVSWSHDDGARDTSKHMAAARRARPSLLSRIAGHPNTLLVLRLSVRSLIQEVADDFLRLRRLAADRAEDGLHERYSRLVTACLQDN